MELNPKHTTTEKMREQWHKIVVALMLKFKVDKVTLAVYDIASLWFRVPFDKKVGSGLRGFRQDFLFSKTDGIGSEWHKGFKMRLAGKNDRLWALYDPEEGDLMVVKFERPSPLPIQDPREFLR